MRFTIFISKENMNSTCKQQRDGRNDDNIYINSKYTQWSIHTLKIS